jgi:hypothetical protein
MFYDTNKVNNVLNCKKCLNRFDEPSLLPCGSSICSFCLKSIKVTNKSEFKCLVCDELHEMPQKGLAINKLAVEMLSFEMIQVSRGKAYNSLKETLKDILNNKSIIEHRLNHPNDFIKEHFIDLRNEVQLATEEIHKKVDDLSEEVILEINEYEKQLISSKKKSSSESKDPLNEFFIKSLYGFRLFQLRTFHLKTEEYLIEPELNDENLDQLNRKAIDFKEKSNLEIKNLKEMILNGRYISFESKKDNINKLFLGRIHNTILNTSILSNVKEIDELICLCDFPVNQQWKLIYKASQDGFEASTFHSKCDKKPNTLIIIKSQNGNVFGGYTEQDWSNNDPPSVNVDKPDQNAFIFSLINKENTPLKIKCSHNQGILCNNTKGPIFGGSGGNSDLVIENRSNINLSSSNLGHYYIHPDYAYGSVKAQSFLAGSFQFQVSEIEVFIKEKVLRF